MGKSATFAGFKLGTTTLAGAVLIGSATIGLVMAAGAVAGPALISEAELFGSFVAETATSAWCLVLANPIEATLLAEYVVGTILTIADQGGLESLLERARTPQGFVMMVGELLILRYQMQGARGPRGGTVEVPTEIAEISPQGIKVQIKQPPSIPEAAGPAPKPAQPAGLPEWLEPTAHPPAGEVATRKPRGFEPTQHKAAHGPRAEQMEGLEPTAYPPTRRPLGRKVTREEQIYGIPSEEKWRQVRAKTPSSEMQEWAQKELPQGSPDPALPGLAVTGPAQPDHIVPVDQIRKMPGFAALDADQQVEVLNMKENFVAMSPAANQSRGGRSFSEWTGHEGLEIPADEKFRQEMMNRERELIPMIQKKMDGLLKGKMAGQD
jgi:hypothetical protein